jgi:hypothetical protein
MSARTTIVFALCTLASTAGPSVAFWDSITAPEIDGPAGISAIAALAAVGILIYQRLRN